MAVKQRLNKLDFDRVRESILLLKGLRVDALLYEKAVDISIARDSTLESCALERANIDGFCRAIRYIFEEMTNE